jgi:hypothetical protein
MRLKVDLRDVLVLSLLISVQWLLPILGLHECPGLLVKSVQQAAGHHDALDRVTPVELAGIHCVRRGVAAECQRHLVTRSVLTCARASSSR